MLAGHGSRGTDGIALVQRKYVMNYLKVSMLLVDREVLDMFKRYICYNRSFVIIILKI